MNGKIKLWWLGVAGCLILAAAWCLLSTPGAALAKGKPPGAGGGNGSFDTQGYWVWFSQDPLGAFEPDGEGPEPNVVPGDVRDEAEPEMFVHGNATCLESWVGGPGFDPSALVPEFADCFPEPSYRALWITPNPDGSTTVWKRVPGLSLTGKILDYLLTIDVVGITCGAWDPLGIAPGNSVALDLGAWTLATQNPKHQGKGCFAEGDFTDAGGTTITVQRWTEDEQNAHNACE